MPRFHVPGLRAGRLALDAAESRHALTVLRLSPGDRVELFDGQGGHATATLVDDAAPGRRVRRGGGAFVEVGEVRVEPVPARRLTLCVAACKGPRLDWLVEKCTELGVDRIHLAAFERSVVHVREAHVTKLLRVATEACKQCGRNRLPLLSVGDPWRTVPTADERLVVCDPESSTTIGDHITSGPGALTAVIGPEGGLTDAENAHLRSLHAVPVRLASHVLRVETAAVAVAAMWAAASRA